MPHWSGIVTASSAYRKPPGRIVLGAGERVAAVGQHVVDRIVATADAGLRAVLVEGQRAGDDLAAPRAGAVAARMHSGVMKLSAPFSSSGPQRPQFE